MQYASRLVRLVALSALVLVNVARGQDAQRTPTYPFGCVGDESPSFYFMEEEDSRIELEYGPERCSKADFENVTFDSLAAFHGTTFNGRADFKNATVNSRAEFERATFDSLAYFDGATFDSEADFERATFNGRVDFGLLGLGIRGNYGVTFKSEADFKNATFNGRANFYRATFDSLASFSSASFWDAANFYEAKFGSTALADFTRASVRDTVWIGSWGGDQRFNFRRANLLPGGRDVRPSDSVEVTFPGAAIVLRAPADIQLQVENIDFLHLEGSLSYLDKSYIVSYLKDSSFDRDDQKTARFELDYLLARSTMDQRPRGTYREYPRYHYRLWWNHVYYYLMGFGYRPFWIFGWAGGLVLLFGVYYLWKMPHQTYAYVQGNPPGKSENPDSSGQPHPLSLLIHCFYFSTMLVFTFRLKRRLLTFFDAREQGIVTAQWGMGFLIYVAFLTLAKSGSILQQLKVLFVG